jgi:alkylation response protein AidB-like acyl-CoA dehydrogenase
MYLAYTAEQQALRREIRQYMAALMAAPLRAELESQAAGGPHYRRAMQQLGADGWLGIGWPVEHGGQGRGPIEQFIFFDEVQGAGFPVPILTLNTVGPTLMRFGTDAQKSRYLHAILAGTCHFSIGYSEPGAGTDLASLKTKAVLADHEYVIEGQKTWTSLVGHADYLWVAVRTDPAAPPHKGISILIVPADAPGVSTTPIRSLGEHDIYSVYFDNVRVPKSALVGEENRGWQLITTQLNHERVALNAVAPLYNLLTETIEWARAQPAGPGACLLDLAWVRSNLALVDAKLDILKLLNWKQAWAIREGRLSPAEASAIKVYGSELYVEACKLLMEVHGSAGALKRGSQAAVLRGRLEKFYRASLVLTFGGGTNEVQRDIIAVTGLGMPRAGR